MKNPTLLVPVCVLLALGAGYAGARLGPDSEANARESARSDVLQQLAEELAGLRSEQASLRAEFARQGAAQLSGSGARLALEDIGAAVETYLAARAELPAARAVETSAAQALAAASSADTLPADDELFALLRGDALSRIEKEELWKRISEAGRTDALIALYEQWAAEEPQNADRQAALGMAYVQKIQEVGGGPLAGVWATKADRAWDRALELDPQHWEARFSKAISLSFWPPIFGKQPEAIRQFELLVQQQDGQPLSEDRAQTYLLLGNLYAQNGQADKATEVWQKGASLYPSDSDLAAKLE